VLRDHNYRIPWDAATDDYGTMVELRLERENISFITNGTHLARTEPETSR
jgi:hypothetical protein